MVREAWLAESIEKQELLPLEAYDCISDRSSYGKGIAWDKQDASEEALESLNAEVTSLFLWSFDSRLLIYCCNSVVDQCLKH